MTKEEYLSILLEHGFIERFSEDSYTWTKAANTIYLNKIDRSYRLASDRRYGLWLPDIAPAVEDGEERWDISAPKSWFWEWYDKNIDDKQYEAVFYLLEIPYFDEDTTDPDDIVF